MSLINEALKEAQRERSGRSEPKAASILGDSYFPYPERHAGRANKSFLYAAIGVIVLLAVGYGAVQFRARRPAAPIPMSSIANQVLLTSPVNPTPIKRAAEAKHTSDTTSTIARATPAGVVVPPRVASTAPVKPPAESSQTKGAPHAVPPKAAAPIEAGPAKAVAVAPPPQAPVQQQGGEAGVRITVDPMGSADSLFRRAYAEQMRGNDDGAADLYEKAINTGHASADLYNNYGALLARRGNATAAIEMYGLSLKRDERNVNAWINLAAANEALGRHAEAMSDYAQAAKLDPMNGVVKARLAKQYLAIGDTASARRNFEDALKASPGEPDVHYAYANFLETARDRAGAIREYDRFLELAPAKYDPATVAQVKQYVTGLRGRPNE